MSICSVQGETLKKLNNRRSRKHARTRAIVDDVLQLFPDPAFTESTVGTIQRRVDYSLCSTGDGLRQRGRSYSKAAQKAARDRRCRRIRYVVLPTQVLAP